MINIVKQLVKQLVKYSVNFTPVFLAVVLASVFFCNNLHAQPATEVSLGVVKTAYLKINIELGDLDVLSGGVSAIDTGDLVRSVVYNDLQLSGLFVAGNAEDNPDSTFFEYTIEGTIEGPLRDENLTGEVAPTTVNLNLMTWPGRQMIMNKRYRPLPNKVRTSAHHFASQVVYALTGEPGISMTRVVFSRGTGDRRDLYCVDYDGETLMRLTANRTLNLCPAWSPDASKIAFTTYRQGQQVLNSFDISNGKVDLMIAQDGLNFGADWHPNGEELVVSLSRGQNPEIYRIKADGQIIKRLTVSKAIEIGPSWSPGGRDIVFTSDRTGTPQLYIIDDEGAGRRRLTFEGRYNASAVWSPDGEKIAYACREGDYTQIVLMSSTGENRRVITRKSWLNAEDPSWAPDGRHIVFTSDKTGVPKLYVYDVVEGNFRQLTFGDDPDITPDWSN